MGNQNSTEEGIGFTRSRYIERRRKLGIRNSDVVNYSSVLDTPRKQQAEDRQDEESNQAYRYDDEPQRSAYESAENQDRVLQRLNKKNEELRRELRQISQMLSQKLQKKKLVVKKRYENSEPVDTSQTKGPRRELENAYRQIDMYKRQIAALRSKQEGDKGFLKVDKLENDILTKNKQIEQLMDKINAYKNIKKGQQKVIDNDLNDKQYEMIESYKKEIEILKTKIKEINKRDRTRQERYKKQQAYLYQVQKRLRSLNGEYFPELKKGEQARKKQEVVSVSDRDQTKKTMPSAKEFNILKEELAEIKKRHDQYHKKIDSMILMKNKYTEERESVENAVKQKNRAIDALKLKVQELKKLGKIHKKNLFGGEAENGTTEQQDNGENEKEEGEETKEEPPDAFNIDHLIANIPRPNRSVRKAQFDDGSSINMELKRADGSAGEDRNKAKVWNAQRTRREEKGEQGKGQLKFDDKHLFEQGTEPKIIGVNLWLTHQNEITGMQAIYSDKGDIKQGFKTSNPNGNLSHYDLKTPDYIKSIGGAFAANGVLEYIMFSSKTGKVGRFGTLKESQKQFTYDIQLNQRPYCFSGASRLFGSDVRITRLNVDICRDS